MSEKHTPGRLAIDDGYPRIAKAADGRDFFLTHERGNGEANARRLVACWNACEMASTEDLEALTRPADVSWACTIDRLVRERDELLAALKKIADGDLYNSAGMRSIARAAIAKVEAGK